MTTAYDAVSLDPRSRPGRRRLAGPVADQVVDAHAARGLQAELAGDYPTALRLYGEAHRLDPIDATPSRYLGEVYRHYTGEWDKARAVFTALLDGPSDPLSRAVALQGLGKITIHEGQYAKGLSLIEESTREFPLALAYRNLAVFWNSECNPVKAAAYVEQALALDPAGSLLTLRLRRGLPGPETAPQRTRPSGSRRKTRRSCRPPTTWRPSTPRRASPTGALEYSAAALLYTYERYQAVRGEEMMEARVDEMFVSLRTDPRFIQLTAMADGRLPVKWMAR